MRKSVLSLGAAMMALTVFLAGCGGTANNKPTTPAPAVENKAPEVKDPETKDLVIYSGRNEAQIKPVVDLFKTKHPEINVVVKAASSAELANLVLEEKSKPKADIYWSNDAGALERLRMEKAFQSYTSENLKLVPEQWKSTDNTWYGITVRVRAIMYNKNLVKESEVPKTTKELADPKWKGQVGMVHGGAEAMMANVTALRITEGDAATEKFLKDLLANDVKLFKGHGDVRQAVGRGELKLGWVNHYYFYQQLREKENNNVGLIYPDQESGGTTVNVSGMAIIGSAPNVKNAKAFMDFMLTKEAQEVFAGHNVEFPIRSDVAHKTNEPLSSIKLKNIKIGTFGAEWDKTSRLIDSVGFGLR